MEDAGEVVSSKLKIDEDEGGAIEIEAETTEMLISLASKRHAFQMDGILEDEVVAGEQKKRPKVETDSVASEQSTVVIDEVEPVLELKAIRLVK
jgi:hypothetical protein